MAVVFLFFVHSPSIPSPDIVEPIEIKTSEKNPSVHKEKSPPKNIVKKEDVEAIKATLEELDKKKQEVSKKAEEEKNNQVKPPEDESRTPTVERPMVAVPKQSEVLDYITNRMVVNIEIDNKKDPSKKKVLILWHF